VVSASRGDRQRKKKEDREEDGIDISRCLVALGLELAELFSLCRRRGGDGGLRLGQLVVRIRHPPSSLSVAAPCKRSTDHGVATGASTYADNAMDSRFTHTYTQSPIQIQLQI
jgi:hypothetical protein